jgi:hypothetical protein
MSDCGRGPKALAVIWGAILCFVATPESVRAQGIQIRVVDSMTTAALSGALVALVDGRGAVTVEGLTSENGYRTFFVPAGRYRVRVRRVGFRPYVSDPLELTPARAVTVAAQSEPVVLSTIVISARSPCRSLGSRTSQTLAMVWGEATKALQASQLTLSDLQGIGRVWTYVKTVGGSSASAKSDTAYFTVSDARPFGALDPDTLADEGYVIGDATSGWRYFGPDETVLLSPSFARTHCFRLVRERAAPGMIGVAFEPMRGRGMADIVGVAWLDERTSELRRIVFRYVNAGFISRYGGGGETNFRRLPSGAWLISSWHLRVPNLAMQRGTIRPDGFQENGGGVLQPN